MKEFLGSTYNEERDRSRLSIQLNRVRVIMGDSQWHTLAELEDKLGHPQASISARLRDLRRPIHGGFTVERRYVRRGLFEYRLTGEQK
jgi:hypothetical protein